MRGIIRSAYFGGVRMSLSDKIVNASSELDMILNIGDVKEFIKELKEIYANCEYDNFDRTFAIDRMRELAGEKLV